MKITVWNWSKPEEFFDFSSRAVGAAGPAARQRSTARQRPAEPAGPTGRSAWLSPKSFGNWYQKAFAHELRASGLAFQEFLPLKVTYEGVTVGDFVADMLVGEDLLIENKAVQNISPAHEAQLVNYLTATGIEVGLLFNFGAERLQFKRKHRTYKPKQRQDSRTGSIDLHKSPPDSLIL